MMCRNVRLLPSTTHAESVWVCFVLFLASIEMPTQLVKHTTMYIGEFP